MTAVEDRSKCQIDRAYLFGLATYPANGVTELKLQHWSSQFENSGRRDVQSMHDCYAVLHQVAIPAETALDHDTGSRRHPVEDSAPSEQRLGLSRILVLQVPANNLGNTEFCRNVFDSFCEIAGIFDFETLDDGSLLAIGKDETLALICGPDQFDSCLRFVVGPFRLFETLRHKVLGQYAEYENEFRRPFLDSTAKLQKDLQALSQSWSHTNSPGRLLPKDASGAFQISHRLTHDHTIALLRHGPVKQVETMLAANLRNLDQTVCAFVSEKLPSVLQEKIASLHMLLAQVRADIQYAQPIFEASQSVSQSFHTEAMADIARVESVENQLRAADAVQRDRLIQRLTLLGLWIGMNQVSNGWLSLPEPVKQWHVLNLLGCLALPTILTGVIWLFFELWMRKK